MSDTTLRHETDKRVVRTKKALKAALFRILEEKDISAITISELTTKANVNRRTFYTHYRNITDILTEIEGDLVDSLTVLVDKFDTKDFKRSTYELFLGLNELITVEFDYYFHLVRVDMRGMLMSRLKKVVKNTTDKLLEQICMRKDKDMTLMSSFIVGGFFNLYLEWHNHPDEISIERAAELVSNMVSSCVEDIRARS